MSSMWRVTHNKDGTRRRFIRAIGDESSQISPSTGGNAEPAAQTNANAADNVVINIAEDASQHHIAPENENPLQQIVHWRITWPWTRFARWLRQYVQWLQLRAYSVKFVRRAGLVKFEKIKPWLDADQKLYYADLQEREALERIMAAEARIFGKQIRDALERMGICHRYARNSKDTLLLGVQQVEFDHIGIGDPNVIHFHVGRMPQGTSYTRFTDKEEARAVATDLTISTKHTVEIEYDKEIGVYINVYRGSGAGGIPTYVDFMEMMEAMPQSADNMTIPMGITKGKRRVYKSLRRAPHLLIAGSTDTGKSVFMHAVICAVAMRSSPDQVRFLMIDLKDGLELQVYEDLPHMLPIEGITDTGVVTDVDRVQPVLDWIAAEHKRRTNIINKSKHRNVGTYNAHARPENRLQYIVVICDEWAQIALGKKGTDANDQLAKLASVTRASGIHFIIATQTPTVRVIPTLFKQNLPTKVAFSCSGIHESMTILDNGQAHAIGVQGRYVFKASVDSYQIQGPLVSEHMVEKIVKDIASGLITPANVVDASISSSVSLEEILRYAIDNLDGKIPVREVWERFRDRIAWNTFKAAIKNIEGTEVTVDGEKYMVVIPARENSPRWLRKTGVIPADETGTRHTAHEIEAAQDEDDPGEEPEDQQEDDDEEAI